MTELQKIRERVENASDGDWFVEDGAVAWELYHSVVGGGHPFKIIKAPKKSEIFAEYWPNKNDSEFIEHAKADIQTLLALLAEGREIVFGFTQFQPEEQTEEMFDEADAWLKRVGG